MAGLYPRDEENNPYDQTLQTDRNGGMRRQGGALPNGHTAPQGLKMVPAGGFPSAGQAATPPATAPAPAAVAWQDSPEVRNNMQNAVKANNARDKAAASARFAARQQGYSGDQANAIAMQAGNGASNAIKPQGGTPAPAAAAATSQPSMKDWSSAYDAMAKNLVKHNDIINQIGKPPIPGQAATTQPTTPVPAAATQQAAPAAKRRGLEEIAVSPETAASMNRAVKEQHPNLTEGQQESEFSKVTSQYAGKPTAETFNKDPRYQAAKVSNENPLPEAEAEPPEFVDLHAQPVQSGFWKPYIEQPGGKYAVHTGAGMYQNANGYTVRMDPNYQVTHAFQSRVAPQQSPVRFATGYKRQQAGFVPLPGEAAQQQPGAATQPAPAAAQGQPAPVQPPPPVPGAIAQPAPPPAPATQPAPAPEQAPQAAPTRPSNNGAAPVMELPQDAADGTNYVSPNSRVGYVKQGDQWVQAQRQPAPMRGTGPMPTPEVSDERTYIDGTGTAMPVKVGKNATTQPTTQPASQPTTRAANNKPTTKPVTGFHKGILNGRNVIWDTAANKVVQDLGPATKPTAKRG